MRRVAVMMGGESQEREVSRVTGSAVAAALAERGWDVTVVDTRDGVLPVEGVPAPAIGARPPSGELEASGLVRAGASAVAELAGTLGNVDAVFIALHGGWGEDGTIQAFFELLGIPYTGSGVLASALAMDKERAKRVMRDAGVPTPPWELVDVREEGALSAARLAEIPARLRGRLVVKPNAEGSTVGLTVVDEPAGLRGAIEHAARYDPRVLLEEFVPGRELTAAVLGSEALPLVEIVPEDGIYTYEAKYTAGKSRYEVPAALPEDLAAEIRAESLRVFGLLGCEGFARVDWRLRGDGSYSCLEVNTIPGMTPLSLVPMAARAAGIEFGELVERLVEAGIARGTRRSRAGEVA